MNRDQKVAELGRVDSVTEPFERIHHDLITVPFGWGRPGIFWLRLYRRGIDHVAVVTEVPGNPSTSMTNAIEAIAAWIEAEFGIRPDHLALFEIWPRGSMGWSNPNVRRVILDAGPTWIDSSKAEIAGWWATRLKTCRRTTIYTARYSQRVAG